MRENTALKTVRLSRSIQLFSGLCALVILLLAFGSSYMESRLMDECGSVLDRYGKLAKAQTQMTDLRLAVEQYLIYGDEDAGERMRERKDRLDQLLEPIGEEVLPDSDSRFYYRTLSVMLGAYFENVESAAQKETVYSLYFDPGLGIRKRGEAIQNRLSEMTTAFLQYRSLEYYAMLGRVRSLSMWRNGMAGLLAMCTIVFACYRFRQGARESERVLVRAHQLAGGKWDLPDLPMGLYDEINEVVSAFNHMKNSICSYIEDLNEKRQVEMSYAREKLLTMKKEKESREWQYRALQMQINPHFLFNTMNVISRTALLGRNETTVLLVESISNIMRYSIGNQSGEARLSEEWDVLNAYVDIQRIRFQDRIKFSVNMWDEVRPDSLVIPPLVFQPFVENSIHHGMADISGGGEITIDAVPFGEGAAVRIRDNGKGISKEILERLNRREYGGISKDSTGIGMQNVIRRLEYFYGRADLVHIESVLNTGTCVTLIIPAERGNGDESGYCG